MQNSGLFTRARLSDRTDGDSSSPVKLEEKNVGFTFFLFLNQQPDHSLALGFSTALLVIGFFLFLIAPTSSDLHHQVRLSHTEIYQQTHEKQKFNI